MAEKVLTNIGLFASGNPSQPVPSKAMMTYTVVNGEGEKQYNGHYDFPDLDSEMTAKELWSEGIEKIKEKEEMGGE